MGSTPPPTGTVTFLFTDIEGSTRLWEEHPKGMRTALALHDRLLRDTIAGGGGYVFATGGDGFATAFQRAGDALVVAVEAQRDLAAQDWGDVPVRVRMALHTGESEERDGDYFGPALNRTARLMSAGHGSQVLVSQTTVEIVGSDPPRGVTFEDLGEHRLKDLDRTERIFQLHHPDLVGEFAPLLTVDARPSNLPVQLTSFVGREDDVAETLGLLSGARILTLTGVGGSGKTRLALRLAVEVLADYPGGVWMIELAPVTDPELVAQTVQIVLGAGEPETSPLEATMTAIAEKHLLLVLDNCEHLIEEVAGLAAVLLARCANLKIVATSREILGVPGEVPFPVQSMALPPADADPQMLTGFDSVRLYTERAATVQPSFEVTDSNAEAVAQICRRLDGMPLALELAAARMRVMTPDQIATRLDDRFALLTGGARTALPRQQTLLATIDWSYQLLDVDEQELFQSLSVFVGGFSLETTEAVCGDGLAEYAVTDLVYRLVDKSLVVVGEEGPEGAMRYRLLETLRQYAAVELAKSGRGDGMRSRHAGATADLVAGQHDFMRTGDRGAALDLLSVEHDNIRAALRWSIDNGELDHVARIGATMGSYWLSRGLALEGLGWTRQILAVIPDTDQATQATFLTWAGYLQRQIGDYESAKHDSERALAIRRRLDDTRGMISTLNALAIICDDMGEYEAEKAYLEEALDLATQLETLPTHVLIANLGWTAWKSDDMQAARSNFQAAIDQAEAVDGPNIDDYLWGLAWVAWVERDFAEAESFSCPTGCTQLPEHNPNQPPPSASSPR